MAQRCAVIADSRRRSQRNHRDARRRRVSVNRTVDGGPGAQPMIESGRRARAPASLGPPKPSARTRAIQHWNHGHITPRPSRQPVVNAPRRAGPRLRRTAQLHSGRHGKRHRAAELLEIVREEYLQSRFEIHLWPSPQNALELRAVADERRLFASPHQGGVDANVLLPVEADQVESASTRDRVPCAPRRSRPRSRPARRDRAARSRAPRTRARIPSRGRFQVSEREVLGACRRRSRRRRG